MALLSRYKDVAVPDISDNRLGAYLMDRRGKLDPAAFGLPLGRRRTPGLRREEVAARAHVSATWYTWLEQGRGGAPSADVLDRLARALMLTEDEREHLFLLGLGRAPDVRYTGIDAISPRLQRVLDAMPVSPAYVRTATWDIVAWNRAAQAALADYSAMPPGRRNALKNFFGNPDMRTRLPQWEKDARFMVAAFRADVARTGAEAAVAGLIDDLRRESADFDAMWRDHDVRTVYGDVAKHVRHPTAGPISLEYSTFAVEGRPDLSLVIYNPATAVDAAKIKALADAYEAVPPREAAAAY